MVRILHQGTVFELVQVFFALATILVMVFIHEGGRKTHCETKKHRKLFEEHHKHKHNKEKNRRKTKTNTDDEKKSSKHPSQSDAT
jgi:hypothetical protein